MCTHQMLSNKHPMIGKTLGRFLYSLLVILPFISNTQAINAANEHEIKAAYLFNLGHFVYWPEASKQHEHFGLCLLGEDPFGQILEAVAGEMKNILELPLKIERLDSLPVLETTLCHLLFISDSEQAQLAHILEKIRAKPILSVSDMEDFAKLGGMIEFYRRDNNIRLKLNEESFADTGLQPSAQLMNLVEIIKAETP